MRSARSMHRRRFLCYAGSVNSLRLLRALVLATLSCCVLLPISGCPQEENVILLEVQSPEALTTMTIEVIPLDGSAELASTVRDVNRTATEIAQDPLHVAIQLRSSREVMVILRAPLSGGRALFAQRCFVVAGAMRDTVWLSELDASNDQDSDGYPGVPSAGCFRPSEGGTPRSCPSGDAFLCAAMGQYDCADTNAARHPFATEVCGNTVDEDCNGVAEDCEDTDGDGFLPCGNPMDTSGTCDCAEGNANIHPDAADPCGDGVDTDCDGEDDLCDRDCDGYPSGLTATSFNDCFDPESAAERAAGAAVHPNGSLAMIQRRSDGDRLARGCAAMVMTTTSSDACSASHIGDGVDQDCNGFVDDGEDCEDIFDRDRDGSRVCATDTSTMCDRNDCDPGIRFGGAEVCGNEVDEDGDGVVAPCAAGDSDSDGHVALSSGGDDCNDADPQIFAGAPEDCTTTVSESCTVNTPCGAMDSDGDHYRDEWDCAPMVAAVHPWATEIECNGVDDDCDGTADELLLAPGDTMPRGCVVRANERVSVDFTDPDDYADSAYCGGCGVTTDLNEDCCGSVVTDVSLATRCGDCSTNCGPRGACNPARDGAGVILPPMPGFGNQYVCGCEMNFASCDGALANGCEIDLLTDENHCGDCSNRCLMNQTCVGGTCACDPNFADCNAETPTADGCEADLRSSVDHCMMCGNRCTLANSTERCNTGSCGVATCDSGFGDCDGVSTNGCEVPTSTTVAHCGACGMNCDNLNHVRTSTCAAGICVIGMSDCDAGFANCDGNVANGCEVELATDANNCNMCGNVCMAPSGAPLCVAGICRVSMCPAAVEDCDMVGTNGCEVTTGTVTSCGNCTAQVNCTTTTVHANAVTCSTGTDLCNYGTCQSGWIDCDGIRANGCETPSNSVTSCGNACGALLNCATEATSSHRLTPGCSAGVCTFGGCETNWANCDAAAGCERSLILDTSCGACTTDCTSLPNVVVGAMCTAAPAPMCSFSCQPGFGDCSATPGCETALTTASSCGVCGSVRNCTSTVVNTMSGGQCASALCTYTGACAANASDCDGSRANGCERTNSVASCGCGADNCNATSRHVTGASCASGVCGFTGCSDSYSDCDMAAANGCEVAPASPTSCGSACGARVDCTSAPNVVTATCTAGACGISACATGSGNCDGNAANGCEANLNSVTSCGTTCGARVDCSAAPNVQSATCTAGGCGITTCNPGFANCDGNAANGCEVNLNSVTSCGTMCAGRVDCTGASNVNTATCSAGVCGITTCDAGFGNCDGNAANGCEVNLNAPTTCGATCGARTDCSAEPNVMTGTCSAGVCGVAMCNSGFGDCTAGAGCETNLNQVNACGLTCAGRTNCNAAPNVTTGSCTAGVCGVTTCDTNFGNCDANASNGCEADLRVDDDHCGMCTNACMMPTPNCVLSICAI